MKTLMFIVKRVSLASLTLNIVPPNLFYRFAFAGGH